jgi:hypothetical protein
MTDKGKHQDELKAILRSHTKPAAGPAASPLKNGPEPDQGESSCAAFGYLRGLRDTSASVEFRLRNGNSVWFPYHLLGPWQYDPSEGLLLKFSGDLMYLVLIRGSNLDKPLSDGSINLTHAGLQRHRVLWVREMSREEIERVGESAPTIDSIEIGEFTSHDERTAWLKNVAPAFVREPQQ